MYDGSKSTFEYVQGKLTEEIVFAEADQQNFTWCRCEFLGSKRVCGDGLTKALRVVRRNQSEGDHMTAGKNSDSRSLVKYSYVAGQCLNNASSIDAIATM